MTADEAIQKMVSPSQRRKGIWRDGVLQIWITRACDKKCFHCTQNSQFGGKAEFITPEQFEQALDSIEGYFGVVGMFGGNPALHPKFDLLCEILRTKFPFEQRGLWCNHPRGHDLSLLFDAEKRETLRVQEDFERKKWEANYRGEGFNGLNEYDSGSGTIKERTYNPSVVSWP